MKGSSKTQKVLIIKMEDCLGLNVLVSGQDIVPILLLGAPTNSFQFDQVVGRSNRKRTDDTKVEDVYYLSTKESYSWKIAQGVLLNRTANVASLHPTYFQDYEEINQKKSKYADADKKNKKHCEALDKAIVNFNK